MRFVTKLGVIALLSVLVASCGGDDKKGGGILGGGTSQSGTSTSGGSGSNGGLNDMSLVYVDSRNGTPQLFVARSDGSSPRKVIDLKQGTRPYDMRGAVLLAGGGDQLMLVDLRDGKTVDTKPNGMVIDARFLDTDTMFRDQRQLRRPGPQESDAAVDDREGRRQERAVRQRRRRRKHRRYRQGRDDCRRAARAATSVSAKSS